MTKRALVSVYDKTGLAELARGLTELGWEILSTGGTAKLLQEQAIPVTPVAAVTGFPEILDGRVKTLHPMIHGGILARRVPEHLVQLEEQGISPIDLVVVNLYPFEATVTKSEVTLPEAIENIDIGGPTMVRAAAKNHEFVAVVVNPARYAEVLEQLKLNGQTSLELRRRLALEAFQHTAYYDSLVSRYLSGAFGVLGAQEELTLAGKKLQDLRYGENPHQAAAFYRDPLSGPGGIASAAQLHGKELSYNNIIDLDAALELVREFDEPAVAVIKHTNPCGVAVGVNQAETYQKAFNADAVSAFGGIVSFNREVQKETAVELSKTFLEAIIAPSYSPEALAMLSRKENLRLLTADYQAKRPASPLVRTVSGGLLLQEPDRELWPENIKVVTTGEPTEQQWQDLKFAWTVVKHVKSNAIVVAKDGVTLGVGAGQMNRVGAAAIALQAAGEAARGAVLASDAFFPFADTVEEAARYGISAIIQPGGSVRDEDSVKAAEAQGLAMVFTGQRHFKH